VPVTKLARFRARVVTPARIRVCRTGGLSKTDAPR
jgi:hypothetical protein